ncbi:MAG: hypothetical protein HQL40_03995 [Alphaproteobacteria bacterium]|nr:hypothetical protein [Alphaproteobacteria bacterium]
MPHASQCLEELVHHEERFRDVKLLDDKDTLWLHIAQIPPRKNVMDDPTENSLSMLRAIVEQMPMEDPGCAGTILFPEYAFVWSDLEEINEIISKTAWTIVLIAGVGAVSGETLIGWRDDDSHLLFENVGINSKYNCGIVAVATSGSVNFIAFVKKFLAHDEPHIAGVYYGEGKRSTAIKFDGLYIWPAICKDLLQDVGLPSRVLFDQFATSRAQEKFLVAAPLLQDKWSDTWGRGLSDWVNNKQHNLVIALANHAMNWCGTPLGALTGVYTRPSHNAKPETGCAMEWHSDFGLSGHFLQPTCPIVISGRVSWPPYKATGIKTLVRHERCHLFHKGSLSPFDAEQADAYAILQFSETQPRSHGLNKYQEFLKLTVYRERVRKFTVTSEMREAGQANDSRCVPPEDDLRYWLDIISYLAASDDVTANEARLGQLIVRTCNVRIRVVVNRAKKGDAIVDEVDAWAQEYAIDPIIVIVCGKTQPSGRRTGYGRRRRLEPTKSPTASDIRSSKNVYCCVPSDDVVNVIEDVPANQTVESLMNQWRRHVDLA